MDAFSGMTFRLNPRSNTRNMSVKEYMNTMTPTDAIAEEFDPMEAMDEPIMNANSTAEAYYNALERFNKTGNMLLQKGVDWTSSSEYAALRDQLLGDVSRNANAVKAENAAMEFQNKMRLQKGVYAPAYDPNLNPSENMAKMVNTSPYEAQVMGIAKELNKMAKSYDTETEYNMVNSQFEEGKDRMRSLVPKMVEQGIPIEQAQFLVEGEIAKLNTPTYNNLAQRKLEGQLQANEALATQRYASAAKTRADMKKVDNAEGNIMVDQMLGLMQGEGFESITDVSFFDESPMFRGRTITNPSNGKKSAVVGVIRDKKTGKLFISTSDKNDSELDFGGLETSNTEKIPFNIKSARELMTASEYKAFEKAALENDLYDPSTGEFKVPMQSSKSSVPAAGSMSSYLK